MKRRPPASPRGEETRGELALRAFHEETKVAPALDGSMPRRLATYLRPDARLVAASVGTLALTALLSLARPILMKGIFDAGAPSRATMLALLVAATLVEQVLVFVQNFALQTAGARAMARLRSHVFSFLHTRKTAFFDDRPIGRLVTRATNDIESVGEMFATGSVNAVGDLVKLVGIVVAMLALDWKLALIAFAALPVIAIIIDWVRIRARVAFGKIRDKTARLNAHLAEQISGMSVIQAYGREAATQAEYDEQNRAYRDANNDAIRLDAILDASVEMTSSICIAALIWYASRGAFGEHITYGTLVAFVAYIEQFFGPIRDLSTRYTQIQSSLTSCERVLQLLEDDGDDDTKTLAAAAGGEPDAALELDHVTFAYKEGHPVLHDLSLRVRRGERVALVGATGSGKSTIAGLFLRLHEATEGVVRVFGDDVRSLDRRALRQRFLVVPQEVVLFPGTIAENVAVGAALDRERVALTLARVGALEAFQGREGGLDAKIDDRGSNFSLGERQLLSLARALYRDADILLLDEATASVDSVTEAKIETAMREVLSGKTAIVIAHRLSTIRESDRIVVLAKGRIVEQGSHDELIARGGVYAKLHELQLGAREPQ